MTILRKTRERLQRLVDDLEAVPVPVRLKAAILDRIEAEPPRVETDRKGGITAVNPAFFELCGYKFSEVRGRKPGVFLQGQDSDPKASSAMRAAIKKGRPCTVENINYHKDGSPYRVRITMEPVLTKGKVTGFRAVEEKLPLA